MIGVNVDASVLGVQWSQSKDTFSFSFNPDLSHNAITKRAILTEVTRLFDPLGFLGPAIVVAKLIIQDLWQSGSSIGMNPFRKTFTLVGLTSSCN